MVETPLELDVAFFGVHKFSHPHYVFNTEFQHLTVHV